MARRFEYPVARSANSKPAPAVAVPAHGGADLHAHTTCSDGLLSPAALVEAAADAGLEAIAVTDHDVVDGIAPAQQAARDLGLELIVAPGIEISSHLRGREVHLLGLFIDPLHDGLRSLTKSQRGHRRERARVMVERVRRNHPGLSMQDVEDQAAGAAIGRPHVARAMVESGIVSDPQSAFDRFLGIGRAAFVPKQLPRVDESIGIVHAAGGVAVIAHPGSSRVRQNQLTELAAIDLDGVEIRHPKHGQQRERTLLALSARLGLLPSGGSDFHGPGKGASKIGQYRVPIDWYENLRRRAAARRGESSSEESDA